jgi:hypothetical protein
MKRTLLGKSLTTVLVLAVSLLVMSACSGVIGGDNLVRITIPGVSGASSSRTISSDAVNGYVVVLKGNEVYSANNFDGEAFNYFVDGQVLIANLPVGDYIFGVALLSAGEEDNVGLAIKEVTIEPGYNDVPITVGPGMDQFYVNGTSINNPFLPEGYSVTFEEDTVLLQGLRNGGTFDDIVQFRGYFGSTLLKPVGALIYPAGTVILSDGSLGTVLGPGGNYDIPYDAKGAEISLNAGVDGTFTYRVLLD